MASYEIKEQLREADEHISIAWHKLNVKIGDLVAPSDPLVLERLTVARYQAAVIHNQIHDLLKTIASYENAASWARAGVSFAKSTTPTLTLDAETERHSKTKTSLAIDDFEDVLFWKNLLKRFNVPENTQEVFFNVSDVTYSN